MNPSEILEQIKIVLPANILLLAGVLVLTLGLFNQLVQQRGFLGGVTLLGLIAAGASLYYASPARLQRCPCSSAIACSLQQVG